MNKELEAQLVTTLKGLTDTAGQIKDFTMEQVPDVIHQWLLYSVIDSSFGVLLGLFIIFISYKSFTKWSEQTLDYSGEWSTSKTLSSIFGGFASLCAVFLIISNTLTIIKIIVAPKVYIIQYMASLIK